MTISEHEKVQALLGVYAVDAVEETERVRVNTHIETCNECREELRQHHEVASLLGTFPAERPDGVWKKIADELSVPPPPFRLTVTKTSTRRRVPWLASFAVAAVVALIAGALMILRPFGDTTPANETELARAALSSPGARTAQLRSDDGKVSIDVVTKSDGSGYLYQGNLPALANTRTYQLWEITDGHVISAGVLGRQFTARAFSTTSEATTLAITNEPAGGVIAPTQHPLVSGQLD